jgi:DNA-directed RNA polymerase subunit omega
MMARVSIEDCQIKIPNRFVLVLVAADRARQLADNASPMVRSKNRESVTALREIAEGAVGQVGEVGNHVRT